MEVAIKLSFLSQNWDRLLSNMVESTGDEVKDEAVYKRTKMAQIRSNMTAWLEIWNIYFFFLVWKFSQEIKKI